MSKRINWNEFFSNEKHIEVMKKALQEEKEDKKRYKDLLAINLSMQNTKDQIQELSNKSIIMLYG